MSDMLNGIARQFDSYSRTARLTPALLLLLAPAAIVIGAGAQTWPGVTGLVAVLTGMGLPIALADWVRRRGQQLQKILWSKWGGNPVVVALSEDGLIASRRRNTLASATNLPLHDPGHADFEEAAGNAVRLLISATRDTSKYALIFVENKAYGFARNILAIRAVGIRLSTVGLIAGIVLVGVSFKLDVLSVIGTTLGVLVAVGALLFWNLYPSEQRVRAAAGDYRDRLLEALDAGALSA